MPKPHDDAKLRDADGKAKASYKLYYDARHGARNLTVLGDGDPVTVKLDKEKGWTRSGVVATPSKDNRSYLIQFGGNLYRRGRKHLRSSPPSRESSDKGDMPLEILEDPVPPISPMTSVCEPHSTMTASPRVIPEMQKDTPTGTKCTASGRVVKPPARYRG